MRCQIPTIDDDDLDLAVSAEIGAESRVSVSYNPALYVADIEQDGPDLGTLIKDNTFRAPAGTSGRDMQLICHGAVLSDESIVVTFNVKLAGALPAVKTITTVSEADPTVITTSAVHGLTSGDIVTISGSDTTPSIDGVHTVTVASTTTFSIPIHVTDGGAGVGSVQGPAGAESSGTATATFNPPGTAQDDSFNFPPGLGVDLIPAGGDALRGIRSIVSIASVVGGKAGNKFILFSLPERATYTEIMCTTDKSIPVPVNKSVAIACRYDGARWVKKGRSEPPNAEFKSKYGGYGDGLPRIGGHRITVMVETRKDDRILTERIFLTGWRPVVMITKGDGDTEAEASASGLYEFFAAFV